LLHTATLESKSKQYSSSKGRDGEREMEMFAYTEDEVLQLFENCSTK